MTKSMPTLGTILMAAVLAASGSWVTPAFADAPVARTGQTTSFFVGDDGAMQAGVPWPTPRFKDEGNGTVEDTLTDLIWLKNANCFGLMNWSQALEAVSTLASGMCGLTDDSVAGNWRVPNVKELQSLIDFGFFGPALSNAAGTAHWEENDAFSGVQSAAYWTSTTYAGAPDGVYSVVLDVGYTFVDTKESTVRVWPVRDRQ